MKLIGRVQTQVCLKGKGHQCQRACQCTLQIQTNKQTHNTQHTHTHTHTHTTTQSRLKFWFFKFVDGKNWERKNFDKFTKSPEKLKQSCLQTYTVYTHKHVDIYDPHPNTDEPQYKHVPLKCFTIIYIYIPLTLITLAHVPKTRVLSLGQ